MLKKLFGLKIYDPTAKIWIDLINWIKAGKRLTYNQQTTIDTVYHKN